MRHLILLFLALFVAPVRASFLPVLRLDQPIAPLDLPAHVQVLYADTLGHVALRVRYQTSAQAAPQNWCIVLRPTASPPPGVPSYQWVSAGTSIVSNPAYGTLLPFWNGVCQND